MEILTNKCLEVNNQNFQYILKNFSLRTTLKVPNGIKTEAAHMPQNCFLKIHHYVYMLKMLQESKCMKAGCDMDLIDLATIYP